MPLLSIIIVNWNTRELLKNCLKSIFDTLTLNDFEVIVVDNASEDGSAGMVEKDFKRVRVFQNKKNEGFAKANNIALKESDSEFILLLNSDTEVKPGSIEIMIATMKNNPLIGVLGGSLIYPNGGIQISFYNDPKPLSEFYRSIFLEKLDNRWKMKRAKRGGIIFVDWVMGSCMLTRKNVIDSIGLLDENVFMYYEDFDFCLRTRKAGWRIAYLPEAKIIHHENASGVKKFSSERAIVNARSLAYFYKKHYGPESLTILKTNLAIEAISRIFLLNVALAVKKNKYYKYRIHSYYNLLKEFIFR